MSRLANRANTARWALAIALASAAVVVVPPAFAAAKPSLGVTYPAQPSEGQRLAVGVKLIGGGAAPLVARLEQRVGPKWRVRSAGRLSRRHSARLSWTPPPGVTVLELRVRVLHGRAAIATSRPRRLSLTPTPNPLQTSTAPDASGPSAGAPLLIDGQSGVIAPDRETIVRNGGYALRVPAGTVDDPATATVTPAAQDDPEASGPAVDVHIEANWADGSKAVWVTLPLPPGDDELGPGWGPGVVHELGDGDRDLYLGDGRHIDAAAGTITVATTSLSVFRSSLFPPTIISAPSANYEGAMKAGEFATRLFRAFIGQQAGQPTCSPAADSARASSSGDAFEPEQARGNEPPIKHCVQAGGHEAEWKLANNTGVVIHYTAADDAEIESVGTSSDPLTTLAYQARNGPFPASEVDVPPGTQATVSVPEGSEGHVSFSAPNPALLPATFILQQLGSLVPGESDAKKLYNALVDCGFSLGQSLKSLSAQLGCARTAAGIAGSKLAKLIEKPLFLTNALLSELDALKVNIDPLEAELAYAEEDSGEEGAVTWTPTKALLPGDLAYGFVGSPGFSSSCLSGDYCFAVGSYSTGNLRQDIAIDTLAEGSWSVATAPLPAGAEGAGSYAPTSSACATGAASGTCVIAGTYTGSDEVDYGLLETLEGGTWVPTKAPLPAGAEEGGSFDLASTACTDAGTCIAVGRYIEPSVAYRGLFEVYDGDAWSPSWAPPPPGYGVDTAPAFQNSAAACAPHGPCIAVSSSFDVGGHPVALIETLADGAWSPTVLPMPDGTTAAPVIGSAVCPSAGRCVVAGGYEDDGGHVQPMIATLADGAWSLTPVPPPAGGDGGDSFFASVDCATAGRCIAVGRSLFGDPGESALVATYSDGAWATTDLPFPGGVAPTRSSLDSAACSLGGICVASGSFEYGLLRGLLSVYSEGEWSSTEADVPADAKYAHSAGFYDASCSTDNLCIVPGLYFDKDDHFQGVIEVSSPVP